jgi:flagellar biosynthesis regulator FlbT
MARFDCEYVAQMLRHAARMVLTASKNHIVLSLLKRIEKAFMRFFRALKQKSRTKNQYTV